MKDIDKKINDFKTQSNEDSSNKDFIDKDKIKVRDRADSGLFTATLEESVEEKRPSFVTKSKDTGRPKRIYLYISLAAIIALISAFFVFKNEITDLSSMQKNKQSAFLFNNKTAKTNNFEINVSLMSDKMINESGISKVISQNEIKNNQVYSLSIKAIQGCIPTEFASFPYTTIFFIKNDGTPEIINEIIGLSNLNKTIYRSDVSGCGEFSAVFKKVIVYHSNENNYAGLLINGLEKGNSISIK